MLLVHEWNAAPLGGNVGLGIVLAIGGMLAASIANVVQANPTGRGVPMVSFLAWAMVYGTIFDLGYALLTVGPPTVPSAWQFWAGTAYLAIIGSVVTFPLHYNLVREIGAGRTAYNGIVTVCVAMGLSTLFEGFKWDALSAGGMALALIGMGLALRVRALLQTHPASAHPPRLAPKRRANHPGAQAARCRSPSPCHLPDSQARAPPRPEPVAQAWARSWRAERAFPTKARCWHPSSRAAPNPLGRHARVARHRAGTGGFQGRCSGPSPGHAASHRLSHRSG